MISGVLTVEFRPAKRSPARHTIRVLVRNADHLLEAIARGVATAIELEPSYVTGNRVVAIDWQRVELDAVT